jgi:signal transduction histidine kinase/ligand-binding sensor domain-containing protein
LADLLMVTRWIVGRGERIQFLAKCGDSIARKRRRFPRSVRVWLCAWLVFVSVPAYGIDRGRKLEELHHTSWSYTEGAPGEVHALAQTTDGYLWLGTATGLFRFDGLRFQAYTPQSGRAFQQRNVISLFSVPDGGLWVGYWYGGVSFIKNGMVTDYGTPEGLPPRAVLAFARDRQGAMWVAAGKDGLARLEGSRWRTIGPDWGFADLAYTVFVDHAGTVWVGTPTSVAYLVEGGHQFQLAANGLQRVKHIAEAPDGTLWMAETGYGVRSVPLRGKSSAAVFVGSQAITFDNQGSLWVTSLGTGIRRVPYPDRLQQTQVKGPSAWQFRSSEVQAFTQQNGLTSDYVTSVLHDREGNVWFGTSGGLDRFRQSAVVPVPLQPLSHPGALPLPSLRSFVTSALAADDQGAVWASGMGPQVLLHIQNDSIATQLRDRPVDCAYRDPSGVIWFATPSSVFRIADERLDTIGSNPAAATYKYHGGVPAGQGLMLRELDLPTAGGIAVNLQSRVKAITQDRLGRLWISMGSGTFRAERSSWTSLERLGGPQGTATSEFTDSQGRIWFGFTNTVVMLDGDRVQSFSGKDGVQIGAVTSIQGKGRTIWIGGELGLAFFDGSRFQPVNSSDGKPFAGVSGIVAAAEDGLWFSDNRGIIHIREDQTQKVGSGEVEFESFGSLDGLTTELRGSLASPSAVQTTDGRIWFATANGLAWINPTISQRNAVPPPVSIESIVADGSEHHGSTLFSLPAGTATLQIGYTATSLTIPERVRFRYKLEGQDHDWQDAGTRREAFYTNLDPGSYQFRVIACNNDGVWNNTGASVSFSIAPSYYQTRWFRAAAGVGVLALFWTLYQLRLRQVAHAFNLRLDERVGERTRIARELHDTLLQSFLGLMLRFQSARDLLPAHPARAAEALDGALDRADQAVVESRDAIQNLRSSTIAVTDLAQAITSWAEEFAQGPNGERSSVTFRVWVVGTPRALHPLLRDDVYRIASEALRNAYRHAHASHIEAEVTYGAREVCVRIRDDGNGIDPQHLNAGRSRHWGLTNMRERAEQIGSELRLRSEIGAGTEVELRIPGNVAYGAPSGRGGLFRMLRKQGGGS